MTIVWGLVVAVGAIAFLTGVGSADASRVWSVYLVNLVFWAGLGVTGPAIAAMMQLTEARWSPSVRRIALTTAGFLPVAFVLFLVLFAGQATLYPWVTTPLPAKQAWLNVPFFWLRTLVGAAALFVAALALVRALVRDAVPPDDARERARRNRLAVVLLFLWVIGVSLWGFDLVMSLDPTWYSGLFGGYFVVSTLYIGFCLLSLLTIRANARGQASIPPAAVQDVAKLQFAISIVVGWLIPFAYLLKRLTGRPPQRHTPLVVVSVFGLVAIFLERVLVVFPSVSPSAKLPFGARDLAITAGFLALFVLCRRWFFSQFKPVINLPHTGH
ncbi:MAG: hypothetical protein AUH99_05025 [Candidatus Rokubacteria bacterium 13_2_20CM_2_70_11]|nr:MAG: hypothetical protein AUH99_05025 [Candidatus Rokubacteria bacterium 13_2_20CM_2_70_11]